MNYCQWVFAFSMDAEFTRTHAHPHMTTHIRMRMDTGSSSERTEHSRGGQVSFHDSGFNSRDGFDSQSSRVPFL